MKFGENFSSNFPNNNNNNNIFIVCKVIYSRRHMTIMFSAFATKNDATSIALIMPSLNMNKNRDVNLYVTLQKSLIKTGTNIHT